VHADDSDVTGIFRTALQASPEKIAIIDDVALNDLMRDLLRAQGYLVGATSSVNTEIKAADDGCDGWSSKPTRSDKWLGETDTCWQFKAGAAGEPAKLENEVLKPIPSKTLRDGGRFVVVCSGSTAGPKGVQARLTVLRDAATAAALPTERIEVYGSELLTDWCNEHPAVASSQAGRPDALCRLSEWEKSDEHEAPWNATQQQRDAITNLARDLDFATGPLVHLHVTGHPGVGKTRFALELCRAAVWAPFVIYVRQAADVRLAELVASCARDKGVRVVVVADEVQLEQLLPLRESIAQAEGRIRLITIGTSTSPDPQRIQLYEALPLEVHEVTKVVKSWFPSMPVERAEFVSRFSAGYMRLAWLAATTVNRSRRMDVQRMLEESHIRTFLDRMLGTADRGALYVVAALSSVGWSGESEGEGRAIAEHLGFDWGKVRRDVEEFDRRFRVAPRGGRLRYISPDPLAIYLALEAWRLFEPEMRALPAKLSDTGKDAYYGRLQALASSKHAGSFAREELESLFPAADLNDARAMRRWSALAPSNPEAAARMMREELERRSVAERLAIDSHARRTIIWGLVALSWDATNFEDAVIGLALLAEAENETFSNNSVGEFLQRFRLVLSGSAASYEERIRVLDKLLTSDSAALRRLAFRALGGAAQRGGFRMHIDPITSGLPEKEWAPREGRDYVDAVTMAIARIRSSLDRSDPALSDVVEPVVGEFAMFLRNERFRQPVIELVEKAAAVYPEQRDGLRRRASDVLHREKKYWKELNSTALATLEEFVGRLQDRSPGGRLHALAGKGSHQETEHELGALAAEFRDNPALLRSEWAWITGGECFRAWAFGHHLGSGQIDDLVYELVQSPSMGRDGRVACGYLHRRSATESGDWLDNSLDNLLELSPSQVTFVLEATWRLASTVRGAMRIQRIIAAGNVDRDSLGQLAYGTWGENLDGAQLRPILDALASEDDTAWIASSMLLGRIEKRPDEAPYWSDLGIRLATNGALIRTNRNEGYEWSELAKRFLERAPREIYSAIVKQQGRRDANEHWFLEHHLAEVIAQQCIQRDPLGTWEETRLQLEAKYSEAYIFTIGFPDGFIDLMDQVAILEWASREPTKRAALLAQLVAWNLSDSSLAASLIDSYVHLDEVSDAFRSRRMSGAWVGSEAAHWEKLAQELEEIAASTRRSGLRKWATSVAVDLHARAERDREREEEEELRERR
jgi:hypothetical protein